MRVIDIFFAFPPIVLAIFLMATLGPSLLNVVIVVALVTIPQFTRIARQRRHQRTKPGLCAGG